MTANLFFLAIGIFVGLFGILLIFAPRTVIRIERLTDHIVETNPKILTRRFLWGVLLILAGSHMVYVWLSK